MPETLPSGQGKRLIDNGTANDQPRIYGANASYPDQAPRFTAIYPREGHGILLRKHVFTSICADNLPGDIRRYFGIYGEFAIYF
jgi:hypothetical protein